MNKPSPMTALVFSVLAFLIAVAVHSQTQTISTPAWLSYLGDGSAGSYTCSSGTCALGDEHWYSSFTISEGATVVSTANNGPFIIRSTGACTVNGTLSNSVNTAHGGGVLNNGDFGGGGGGGGGGNSSGSHGLTSVGDGNVPIVGSGAGGPSHGEGGNGTSTGANQYHALLASGTYWAVGGSTGGNGGGNGNGTSGGKGGNGGGPVILVCETIHFTGTIDASGAPGAAAPANNTGGGGGGGGGYVILAAKNYTANSGTIKTSGGTGGGCGSYSGCGAGGAGGNGWKYVLTIN
jgi:hypothetical protein